MLGLLEHSPDLYLDEIQEQLEEQHGIETSLSTISKTLKRLGMSSKKAQFYDYHREFDSLFFILAFESCPRAQ